MNPKSLFLFLKLYSVFIYFERECKLFFNVIEFLNFSRVSGGIFIFSITGEIFLCFKIFTMMKIKKD